MAETVVSVCFVVQPACIGAQGGGGGGIKCICGIICTFVYLCMCACVWMCVKWA